MLQVIEAGTWQIFRRPCTGFSHSHSHSHSRREERVPWTPRQGPSTGSPLLVDLQAWFEARVTDVVPRGDHTVYVAEVVEVGLRSEAKPLELSDTDWSYGG